MISEILIVTQDTLEHGTPLNEEIHSTLRTFGKSSCSNREAPERYTPKTYLSTSFLLWSRRARTTDALARFNVRLSASKVSRSALARSFTIALEVIAYDSSADEAKSALSATLRSATSGLKGSELEEGARDKSYEDIRVLITALDGFCIHI